MTTSVVGGRQCFNQMVISTEMRAQLEKLTQHRAQTIEIVQFAGWIMLYSPDAKTMMRT